MGKCQKGSTPPSNGPAREWTFSTTNTSSSTIVYGWSNIINNKSLLLLLLNITLLSESTKVGF
jgi:hypothetical protein